MSDCQSIFVKMCPLHIFTYKWIDPLYFGREYAPCLCRTAFRFHACLCHSSILKCVRICKDICGKKKAGSYSARINIESLIQLQNVAMRNRLAIFRRSYNDSPSDIRKSPDDFLYFGSQVSVIRITILRKSAGDIL